MRSPGSFASVCWSAAAGQARQSDGCSLLLDDSGTEADTDAVAGGPAREAVPTVTLTGRLATLLVPLVAGALFCAGCAIGTPGSTGESSPVAALTATPDRTLKPTSTSAERGPLTGRELLWVQASEQLLPKMNKVFVNSPTDMTLAVLRSLANQVRGGDQSPRSQGSSHGIRVAPGRRI